jgi:twitching motility protein PilU
MDLSLNLKAFVSQRLVPTIDGKRIAAFEILLGTQLIRDLIQKGDIHGIKEVMDKSEIEGMQTFDSHLLRLFKEGTISKEEALQNSDSRNNLKLKINLCGGLASSSTIDSTDATKSDLVGKFSLQSIRKDDEQEN